MELTSPYLSDTFREKIWPAFQEEFADRPHTLKNYKNILQAFCGYIGKDFLEAREEDVTNYYKFLSVRCELGTMSRRSMLTYQKTLRALAYKTEEIIAEQHLAVFFLNMFKDTVAGDVRKIREDMWLASPEEISALMTEVRNAREMMLLQILTEGALTAAQIRELTWECMKPKAGGQWFSYDQKHGFFASEFFRMTWKDYLQEAVVNHTYQPRGPLFVSGQGNRLDTKNISTLIKRLRKHAGLTREITARQLRDYALLLRLDDLLTAGEEDFEQRVVLDEAQKTRMRELYQWMIQQGMIEG